MTAAAATQGCASLILPSNVLPRFAYLPEGRMVDYETPAGIVAFYNPCYICESFFIRQKGKFL